MKASKIILYVVIAAVVYYVIYKAYKNYQASGNIFRSSGDRSGGIVLNTGMPPLSGSEARFALLTPINSGYTSARDCLKRCPSCTWTTNGKCWPAPSR